MVSNGGDINLGGRLVHVEGRGRGKGRGPKTRKKLRSRIDHIVLQDHIQPLLLCRQAGHGHLVDQHQVWKLPDIRGADPILAVGHLDMKNPLDLVKVELTLECTWLSRKSTNNTMSETFMNLLSGKSSWFLPTSLNPGHSRRKFGHERDLRLTVDILHLIKHLICIKEKAHVSETREIHRMKQE
ncbi:hypothetical protein BT96DRAFT_990717 [Gymnopus androsaceus JB14]|uniref:Uncharacterized protein n=1 Tax=Gymnopus androsaceus JB14 TaxID=1447944 RepID=A0A6A4I257_9AGAR|nr:hypothetical protein BT96DRAFT_990717 [Gymnopus androsaceus JB14]